MTVASLATIAHCRPSTTPMPVTIPARGRVAVVELERGERVQLEERGAGVDEAVDPLARRELAARAMPLERLPAASACDERGALAQLRDELLHPLAPSSERVVPGNGRLEHGHGRELTAGVCETGATAARGGSDERPGQVRPRREPAAGGVVQPRRRPPGAAAARVDPGTGEPSARTTSRRSSRCRSSCRRSPPTAS